MTSFTLTFMTGRVEPHLDWLLDSIAGQLTPGDRVDLIVVDARARERPVLTERELVILDRHELRHVSVRVVEPKPTIWQGAHRITSCDWWATANARNTAIVLARHDFIAFLDDRTRLGPHWMRELRSAEDKRQSVLCGAYHKIEDGKVTKDHRLAHAPNGRISCGGGWLYGCSFALPLEWALEVNGLEEGCDSLTGEDYIFGLMLGNAGYRIDYVPAFFVEQDRSMGTEHGYASTDKGTSPHDKSHAALERFGKARHTTYTPDLRQLRAELAAGGRFPIPDPAGDHRDWWDGQLVREMGKEIATRIG